MKKYARNVLYLVLIRNRMLFIYTIHVIYDDLSDI